MTRFVLSSIAALTLLSLACASSAPATSATSTSAPTAAATPAAASVSVSLKDFSVTAAQSSVAAGSVTFQVQNDGKLPHQFVVVRSDLDPASLPLLDQKEVDETKVQIVTRISDFDAGQTKTASAELDRGKYVLLCNVPSHYSSGMFTAFTVQ